MAKDGNTVVDFPRLGTPLNIPGGVGAVIAVIFLLVLLAGSWFTVDAEEQAVVLRFGRFIRTAGPGLHFKIPLADAVEKVPLQRQLKEEFGFRTTEVGIQSQFSTRPDEANMLTGDLNVAVVEWVVQYRIVDAYDYLFKVRRPRDTLRDMSEAVMREVVGDRTVHEVLTVGRQEVADLVGQELQALCEQYENGLRIEQVVLQDANPPDPVKPSFNEVNNAQQDKEKLTSQAQSEYNKVVPRARGRAQQTIEAAEGYALERVNRARGEAARFDALFEEYRQAPEVTRKRIYLETLEAVLPAAGRKVVIDGDAPGVLPLLDLDGRLRGEGGSP